MSHTLYYCHCTHLWFLFAPRKMCTITYTGKLLLMHILYGHFPHIHVTKHNGNRWQKEQAVLCL